MVGENMQTTLDLMGERKLWQNDRPLTPNTYFSKLFPSHTNQFGHAFLELRENSCDGFSKVTPISINLDFFASILSDPALGLSVVYFEPEMQFYYSQPFDSVYKCVSPEKLQSLYRGLLIRCAQSMNNEVNILNLFHEFRNDKTAKLVVQRAKSVLAADQSYFSATSKHQRVRGIELFERIARKFVDDMLTCETGQILRLADAYAVFRSLLKQRELPDIKRSDFKAVVGPLIREQFNVALRNDLGGVGGRGWKDVKMLQSGLG
jgi:hypothetical protein